MKKIAVIGAGYVGLVTGTCFAELGNTVTCIDSNAEKIALLREGKIPFFEPGLEELVRRNYDAHRLKFSTSIADGILGAQLVFIAVGTPMGEDGHADLDQVRNAAREIAAALDGPKIIVNKSTVPVETGDLVAAIIREHNTTKHEVSVVSNPEFLREGSAVLDFMEPDRIVIGTDSAETLHAIQELYAPLASPVIATDVRTAEMIKYTANAFLATKISFINEIANICDRVGADVKDVVAGAGSDKRIGTAFLNAGIGFGGSCFPKDVTALSKIAEEYGVEPLVLGAVLSVNRKQIVEVCNRLQMSLGELQDRQIAVLGLSFKPNTDDIRESPAIALIEELLFRGARVTAHDPVAMPLVQKGVLADRIAYAGDALEAARDVDAVVLATDWNEYKQLDLTSLREQMRGTLLVDGRNIYDPALAAQVGLVHIGIGRGRRAVRPSDVSANV